MKNSIIQYSEKELVEKQALVKEVDNLLTKKYGNPAPMKKDAVHELILTVLSQNTSDHNRDLAFKNLTDKFPRWEQLWAAPLEEIEAAIRPGGLAKQKSQNIKQILCWLRDQSPDFNLNWLGKIPLQQALNKLISLKGVGIKTASVVMCFCFDAPLFPVDVHIHRICRRLHLSPQNGTAEMTHRYMQPLIPYGRWQELHLNLLILGRSLCRPKNPGCMPCPLNEICQYYKNQLNT